MRCRIFDGSVLINTIIADEAFAKAYCSENGYTFEEEMLTEPEPDPEPEPSAQDDTDAMLIDHEYRLTLLELGLTEEV